MKFFFFLFASTLFASVNEPLRFELFSGYRNDRIHWHLQEPGDSAELTYSELYRDIEYWENGLTLKAIHRDLTFFLRGSYGTFGQGSLIEKTPPPGVRFGTNGWTADGMGYFGYSVNLTADRTYKVIFTPMIGYSAHFEQLHPSAFRLVWNGFLFGGAFTIEPGGRMNFHVGYAYNLLHNRVHTGFVGSTPFHSLKTNTNGNLGQSGWAQIDWIVRRFWRVGFGGLLNYFSTSVVEAHIRQIGAGDTTQKFKLRETAFSCWFQFGREF